MFSIDLNLPVLDIAVALLATLLIKFDLDTVKFPTLPIAPAKLFFLGALFFENVVDLIVVFPTVNTAPASDNFPFNRFLLNLEEVIFIFFPTKYIAPPNVLLAFAVFEFATNLVEVKFPLFTYTAVPSALPFLLFPIKVFEFTLVFLIVDCELNKYIPAAKDLNALALFLVNVDFVIVTFEFWLYNAPPSAIFLELRELDLNIEDSIFSFVFKLATAPPTDNLVPSILLFMNVDFLIIAVPKPNLIAPPETLLLCALFDVNFELEILIVALYVNIAPPPTSFP